LTNVVDFYNTMQPLIYQRVASCSENYLREKRIFVRYRNYATEQFRLWTVDDSALYFWFADSGGPYSRWQIRLFLPDSFTAYDNADWGWMTFTPVDP